MRSLHFPLYESQVPGSVYEGIKVPEVPFKPVFRGNRAPRRLEVAYDRWDDIGVSEQFMREGEARRTEALRREDKRISDEKDALNAALLGAIGSVTGSRD